MKYWILSTYAEGIFYFQIKNEWAVVHVESLRHITCTVLTIEVFDSSGVYEIDGDKNATRPDFHIGKVRVHDLACTFWFGMIILDMTTFCSRTISVCFLQVISPMGLMSKLNPLASIGVVSHVLKIADLLKRSNQKA